MGVANFKDIFAKFKAFGKVKGFFAKMSKRRRITLAIVAGAVVLSAIVLTVALRSSGPKYVALYKDITPQEASEVYQTLLELGAKPKIGPNGQIMVPNNEYDIWIFQLAALGYPKTAMTYDIFSSHTGLTSTESEKKQWLLYQLQDRIQATLMRIEGVTNATVTINLPDSTGSVWQTAESKSKATAGVLLTLGKNVKLSGEQVAAIKNLVASSVPNMSPEDVTVVDALTGLELKVEEKKEGITNTENLLYEQMVQRQIEDNIVRLLKPRYGEDGVVAVAKVTIDYDKMISERMELLERPDGGGYTRNEEGQYSVGGEVPAGDIVGEENNTDIPQYAYNEPGDEEGMTYYYWNRNYDYGYIKTQIEKGNAKLDHATVSVMVKEPNFTENVRNELVSLVARSVNIDPEYIYVSTFGVPEAEPTPEEPGPKYFWEEMEPWMLYAAGGALLLLIIVIVVLILLIRRRRKLRRLREMAEEQEAEENRLLEIEEYKKQLELLAKSGMDVKDEAVLNDVRTFAKEHPEVTANLIRSWLKESE